MWSYSRRIILLIPLVLAACGFDPVYKAGSPAHALLGQIDIQVKNGRFDYALRDRLQQRLGQGGANAPYDLRYNMNVQSSDLVISDTADITRFVLDGQVTYHILRNGDETPVHTGTVQATTAYSATAGTYQTEVARKDANTRLSYAMAERIVDQLAISAQDWLN